MRKHSFSGMVLLVATILLFSMLSTNSAFAKKPERVGVYLLADLYPGKEAKISLYSGYDQQPIIVINKQGSIDMGQYRLPALNNIVYIPVYTNHPLNQADYKVWAHKFGFVKLLVLNLHGTATKRALMLSSQTYEVTLDAMSYNCNTGNQIYQQTYKDSVSAYPKFDASQVKKTAQGIFTNFCNSITLFLQNQNI